MRRATLYHGDALEVLFQLPAGSVHCVVTSPPYWGLRNYKDAEGQIGLEKTPERYVEKLVAVFRELRRVLRDDGTCWLNLGDSYAGTKKSGGGDQGERWESAGNAGRVGSNGGRWCTPPDGLKPGDLVGIPWRVAFALQADGWWLRKDNIWAKPSPMPESVNGWRWERCRVKVGDRSRNPADRRWTGDRHQGERGKVSPSLEGVRHREPEWEPCPGCPKCEPNDGLVLRRGSWRCTSAHEYVFQLAKSADYFCDAEAVREVAVKGSAGATLTPARRRAAEAGARNYRAWSDNGREADGQSQQDATAGRNPRSVWEITTKPFSGSHFATFPPELPERCIKAGTAEKNCGECGAPWAPVVESESICADPRGRGSVPSSWRANLAAPQQRDVFRLSQVLDHRPTCDHNAAPAPAVVLDPYCGSGTTGLVALRLNRDFVGIDLAYCDMAEKRIRSDAPLLNTVDMKGMQP